MFVCFYVSCYLSMFLCLFGLGLCLVFAFCLFSCFVDKILTCEDGELFIAFVFVLFRCCCGNEPVFIAQWREGSEVTTADVDDIGVQCATV